MRIGGFFPTRTTVRPVVGVVLDGHSIQRQCVVLVLRLVAVCAWRGKCSFVTVIAAPFNIYLVLHKSQGFTFTCARVLVRAVVDGPGCPPTDTQDHTR